MHKDIIPWKKSKAPKTEYKINMRVHLHGDREAGVFAEMLINVVDGKANIT